MTRLRILIKMKSADAFELKAQALNTDPRLAPAGISALKFTGDRQYVTEGEFSPDLPPPTAPVAAPNKPVSDSTSGKKLRAVLRMSNQDSYEFKAQALNNDPRLKDLGIAALKFVGDQQYITEGRFSPDLPAETIPATDPDTPKPDTNIGEGLRVVLRMSDQESYELKAQALNDDHRLKEAGVSAMKFVRDGQYIRGGEFSPDPVPSPKADAKVRVVLRAPTKVAYELIARQHNHDPELARLGIAGIGLIKGSGVLPAAKLPEKPAQFPKKKRNPVPSVLIAIIVALILVGGAGALFFSGPPVPTQAPSATAAGIIPVAGEPTGTDTPVPATETTIPPTATLAATNTQPPTTTITSSSTPTVLACVPPTEVVVVAENLSCRYGPGAAYLYRAGLLKGNVVDVLGKADTAYGTWVYVQTRWEEPVKCWVNSGLQYVEVPQGDVACLESYYPEKAPLIIFDTSPYPADRFPAPSNVEASRSGNIVNIQWVGKELLPGDKPENSRRYLVETWTCQDGEIVFSPQGWDDTFAWVEDEAGCAEPSYGYVYMAHVDGYVGPSVITWPE